MAGDTPIPLFRGRVAAGALEALATTLSSGQLASGARTREFEAALGARLGNPHCVATSDRAGALTLALRLCGVNPGDEVLLSPLACLATTMPLATLGAKPVWCEIDPDTGMLDPSALAARCTARTRAIVHYLWGGDTGPLSALQAAADALGLPLILDASSGFGARYGERWVGATGSAYTVFSFYAVAHLSTADGGALCCPTEALASEARRLRRFGIDTPSFRLPGGDLNPASDIPRPGYSFAMTDLTAALALAQLEAVDDTLARHRANAAWLDTELQQMPHLHRLRRNAGEHSAFWVYALRTARREPVLSALHAAGIGAQRLHLRNDHYSCFAGTAVDFPGVKTFDAENFCVPCGWWLTPADLVRIRDVLRTA